jgi:site-specific DNA-methyltransferase (adenine-specific)
MKTRANLRPLLKSAKQTWRTPAWLVRAIQTIGPITLDPCASRVKAHHFAERNYTRRGLVDFWPHHGLVYVNPPYSRAIATWAAHCRTQASRGATVLLLVPARPDTAWWHESVATGANRIAFLRGRLKFQGARHAAPFPSALVLYTIDLECSKRFRATFERDAWIVDNLNPPRPRLYQLPNGRVVRSRLQDMIYLTDADLRGGSPLVAS